ncbi:MAG: LTA synthase family protein [Bacteriovorax sp.]|jgi:phosphoglycerol transferase MdoB-like AlkP superfamily enzyme
MKNKILNTPKLKFLYSLFLFQFLLLTFFRLFFLAYFSRDINPGSGHLIWNALLLGLRFDIRLSMFLLIPALIAINLPVKNSTKINFNNIFYSFLMGIVSFLFITDAGYFSYLKSRLNSTVIQFLKNPAISFEMVRESYPWPLFILMIVAFMALTYWIMKKLVTPLLESWHYGTRKEKILSHVVFFFVFALGIYGSVKRYPLRWSEAFASPDTFSSNLALNPILYVIDTYSFSKKDFDEVKVHEAYPIVATFLGIDKNGSHYNEKNLDFIREYPGNPERQLQKPNVIVIIMESMGYYKTGIGGSAVNPTPNLDSLSKDSLLFTKFYTPTVATARSIFAAITSLPDISKVQTGTRNPFVVNQHTVIGELKDYEKYYFLGGSANWGNIRGVLSYNIPELHIYEEGSYVSPKVDVWGISDLNLFKEGAAVLNSRDANSPFFAVFQSSGFHRPYTIPDDSDGFKILTSKDIAEKEIRDYGFESIEEYNAMRLQDHALGRFMEIAKKEKWYENTIFLIFGDHSLPANNAKNIKTWEMGLSNGFHVPLIVHSPKYIKPGIEEKIASEMDVMPTVAGLTGIPYKTRSFGKDLFNTQLDSNRAAFSYNWYAPYHIALIDKEFYFEYITYNNQGRLVRHIDASPEENVKEKYPEKYREMEILTKGLYESAKYLLLHNPHFY